MQNDQKKSKGELFREAYSAIPSDLQSAMSSPKTSDEIQHITKTYKLDFNQEGALTSEVGNVMVGLTRPQNFIKNIQKNVGVDTATAKKITERINNEIFAPVRESLKQVHHIGDTERPSSAFFIATSVQEEKPQNEAGTPAQPEIIPDTMKKHPEKYQKLPKDIKQAILSIDSSQTLKGLALEYNLHIDQTGALGEVTGLLMLGEIHPRDFTRSIQKKVGIDKISAQKITEKINEAIFQPVQESLKKIHHIGEKEEEEQRKKTSSFTGQDLYQEAIETGDQWQ